MHRLVWEADQSTEFHIPHGEWIRLLRSNGFEVEDLIELQAPEGIDHALPVGHPRVGPAVAEPGGLEGPQSLTQRATARRRA
jgi:hypothetical protein